MVGTWRRADEKHTLTPWRMLLAAERQAVEQEAASLPLPGLRRAITLRWDG